MFDVGVDAITGISRIRLSLHRDREAAKALGATLRRERSRRGWTLRSLAEAMGDVSEQYVGMIERGERRPSHEIFLRLVSTLDLDPEVEPDGGITFWCSGGTEHVTVYLGALAPLRDSVTAERVIARKAEDADRLGQIVAVLARDREALLSVFRTLGLDEDFTTHMELVEAAAEMARER